MRLTEQKDGNSRTSFDRWHHRTSAFLRCPLRMKAPNLEPGSFIKSDKSRGITRPERPPQVRRKSFFEHLLICAGCDSSHAQQHRATEMVTPFRAHTVRVQYIVQHHRTRYVIRPGARRPSSTTSRHYPRLTTSGT